MRAGQMGHRLSLGLLDFLTKLHDHAGNRECHTKAGYIADTATAHTEQQATAASFSWIPR